jgi:hypothetical protein
VNPLKNGALLALPFFLILFILCMISVNFAQSNLFDRSPAQDKGNTPPEVIIILRNTSSPIVPSTDQTAKNQSAVSESVKYLKDNEQTILNNYSDGFAVSIPLNSTHITSSSIGDKNTNESNATTLIDLLSIYAPTSNISKSDITSTPTLNSSVSKEKDINKNISTPFLIPAQNATLLGTKRVNDSVANILSTPIISNINPIKNVTLKTVISLNTANKNPNNIIKNMSNANNITISIPAQNATLLGTKRVNDSTVSILSISAQNATIVSTNTTSTINTTISIPAQNATVLAASKTDQSVTNASDVCEIIKLNPSVKSCIPNDFEMGTSSLYTDGSTQIIPTGLSRIEGNDTNLDYSNKNLTIAIIDTGVNLHPDLNIVGTQSCINTGKINDDVDHGTLVAGVAAAKNNSFGVMGAAPGAKIFSIKVSQIINGEEHTKPNDFRCAFDIINKTKGIDVVNISMNNKGGASDATKAYELVVDYIKDFIKKNITIVGSAGNDQRDAQSQWPGNDPNVITVGAISDSDGKCGGTGKLVQVWSNQLKPPGWFIEHGKVLSDKDDSFANSYSNYGNAVDIVAPGTDILSTNNTNGYSVDSGTSFAAPYVAGAAAVYKANHPNANSSEVLNALLNSSWKSRNASCFYNIDNLIGKPPTPLLHIKPLEKID